MYRDALETMTRVETTTVAPGKFVVTLPDVVNDDGAPLVSAVTYGFLFGVTGETPTTPTDDVFEGLLKSLHGKTLVVREND